MSELLVKVKTRDAGEIIGLLVETHLVPQQGQPQFGMTSDKKLVQGPQETKLVIFALVAHPSGFTFGPLGDVTPVLPPNFPRMSQTEGCPNNCDGESGSCSECSPQVTEEEEPKNNG